MDIFNIFDTKINEIAIEEKKTYLNNFLIEKGFIKVQDNIFTFDYKLDCDLSVCVTNQEAIICYNWNILDENDNIKLKFDVNKKKEIKFYTKDINLFKTEFEQAHRWIRLFFFNAMVLLTNCPVPFTHLLQRYVS